MNKTINGLKKLISARRAHIVSSQPKAAFEKMPDLSIEKEVVVPPMPEIEVVAVKEGPIEVPAEPAEAPIEEAPAVEVAEAPAEEEAPAEKPSRKSKKKKKS